MSSKAGKRIFIACVLMTSAVIGLVFVRSSATEEMVGGSVVVLNDADVDFYPSVRSLDDKGQVTGSAGYPVGPRAGGGGGMLRVDSRTLAPRHSNGRAVSVGRLA